LLHVTGVMDVAIVERGRNVVSASRDGTARLWDCGKSACLAKYAPDSVINGCSLHTPPDSIDLLQLDHAHGIVFTAASDKLVNNELQFIISSGTGSPRLSRTKSKEP